MGGKDKGALFVLMRAHILGSGVFLAFLEERAG
jgi:hypothetical protein